jgi:ABC-2 type transport system permease protein
MASSSASFVLQPVLFAFGWENTLYLPGAVPTYLYSDMNGYGHFVPALLWSIVYWFAIFAFLAVVSMAYTRRGADVSLALAQPPGAAPRAGLGARGGLFLLLALGAGGWYYYNAHVLNQYMTAADRRHALADYERQFKKYENLPQPKITAVDTSINIYPERRSFDGTDGSRCRTRALQPMSEIHLTDQHEAVSGVKFDRPFHLVSRAARNLY